MEKQLILGIGHGKYRISLEYLAMPENKKVERGMEGRRKGGDDGRVGAREDRSMSKGHNSKESPMSKAG